MSVRNRLNRQQTTITETETLGLDLTDYVESEEDHKDKDFKALPEKFIFNSSLDNMLPNHKEKRKVIKDKLQLKYWDEKLNSCLQLYDIKADKYNIKLVKACCQIVEKYMIYSPKLGETKKKIVIRSCSKFFDDNELLLDSIIEEALETIDRSTTLMRLIAKIELFFFSKS
jgi:hypothetical protein